MSARRQRETTGPRRPGVLDRLPEATPALLAEGYWWGTRQCAARSSDVAPTRLLGRRATVALGRDAAERFYGEQVRRAGAAPRRLQRSLLGVGGVQGLDGAAHRHRKRLFLDLLTPPASDELTAVIVRVWRDRLPSWERAGDITLFDELGPLLCQAVCEWARVPLPTDQVARRATQLEALIDAGSGVGPRYWRSLLARRRLEAWLSGLIEQVRRGNLEVPVEAALARVARHTELDGQLLDARIAAVELLNILRPTVAIDRFIVFLAVALHDHPEWRRRVADDPDATRRFVTEVRRHAPFFPLVAGRAADRLTLGGQPVQPGTRLMLDLFGSNRDPRTWPDPDVFDPARHAEPSADPFLVIPQGGGDHATGHRCAGEWVTVSVMEAAARLLTHEMTYRVPPQNLRVDMRRMPTLAASGLRLTDVRREPEQAPAD